jgi:methylenetetrahydrofolate dehydrogenase (NADP+)/methenyltetrahydrofolate cyclohydrolase
LALLDRDHDGARLSVELREGAAVGRIWDGDDVARNILQQVRDEVIMIEREGRSPPVLAEVRIGPSPLGDRVQALQEEACRYTGVAYHAHDFPLTTEQHTILQALAELNNDPQVSGIVLQEVMAAHRRVFAEAVAPEKDVDGVHPLHLGRLITNKRVRRATRGGEVIQLLRHREMTLVGAHVICIGNASGLGGVLAILALHENATISALCCAAACPLELVRDGDVLVLDTDDHPALHRMAVKAGAVIIDARCHAPEWTPSQEPWFAAVSWFIPMPGGMGPATVARRLASLVALSRMPDSVQATR